MKSIYDEIKTAEELVKHVMCHGLSTKDEDICRAQDIFGHSTIEELDLLANDNGACDEYGNPDPNGSWFGGRKGTKDTFYSIAFTIWHWEDAVRFWNLHTNMDRKELELVLAANKELEKKITELQNKIDLELDIRSSNDRKLNELHGEIGTLEDEREGLQMTIIELKAKLYDLMTKE